MTYITEKDFLIEVAKGNVAGHAIKHVFGRNSDIDTATVPEDLWPLGGLMDWPTAAQTLDIVSTSANDDGNPTTNTGAQTLTIEGLDTNFDEISETVTLNGTSTVTTSSSFRRVNKAYVATTGTYHGNNEGDITGDQTTSGDNMFDVITAFGHTQLGRYTVPLNKTAYLLTMFISVDSSKSGATVQMFKNPDAHDTSQPYSGAKTLVLEFDGVTGEEIWSPRSPTVFAQRTDIWVEVSAVGANDTAVDVDFDILLVDN